MPFDTSLSHLHTHTLQGDRRTTPHHHYLQCHVESVKNTWRLQSAGPSSGTDILTNANELNVIEVFITAVLSVLADEGLTVPTEEAKLCLEILNLCGIAKV